MIDQNIKGSVTLDIIVKDIKKKYITKDIITKHISNKRYKLQKI